MWRRWEYIITSSDIWLWNLGSYTKGGMQAEDIWKQDPEANIWARGMTMESGEGFTMSNFVVCAVHLI